MDKYPDCCTMKNYNYIMYMAGIKMKQSTKNTLADLMVDLPVMSTSVPQGLY